MPDGIFCPGLSAGILLCDGLAVYVHSGDLQPFHCAGLRAAVCAKKEVAQAFEPGDHGTTFGGNPLSTAAGLAVFDAIENEKLIENSYKMGKQFKAKLNSLKDKYSDKIVDVRGEGLLIGVEIKPEYAKAVFEGLHSRKMLTSLCKGLTIRVAPPLNITETEIDIFIDAFENVLKEDI